jgi:hypothetical protein
MYALQIASSEIAPSMILPLQGQVLVYAQTTSLLRTMLFLIPSLNVMLYQWIIAETAF